MHTGEGLPAASGSFGRGEARVRSDAMREGFRSTGSDRTARSARPRTCAWPLAPCFPGMFTGRATMPPLEICRIPDCGNSFNPDLRFHSPACGQWRAASSRFTSVGQLSDRNGCGSGPFGERPRTASSTARAAGSPAPACRMLSSPVSVNTSRVCLLACTWGSAANFRLKRSNGPPASHKPGSVRARPRLSTDRVQLSRGPHRSGRKEENALRIGS